MIALVSLPLITERLAMSQDTNAPYLSGTDTVQVTGGTIAAATDSTAALRVFKGIPFAAPPIGALRWKSPRPVVPWVSVRRSQSFGSACMMEPRPVNASNTILNQGEEAQSEDCLYLNVWTGAASAEKRPVMLYIYGGGYRNGAGSQPNYHGTGLAQKGAVVVTFNYRLGPLGFLAHPELSAESDAKVSGNYALLDTLAALNWVQQNITTFGGDPGNVTVYSESAGAGMASVLLVSPLAKGLFHRMTLESLAVWPDEKDTPTLAQSEAAGVAYTKNLGVTSLAELRGKHAHELVAGTGYVRSPIVDGHVLPEPLDRMFAQGKVNDVPLLTGWNADEGTPYPPFATNMADYDSAAAKRFGSMASRFKEVYPVSGDADVLKMAYAPMRDGLFAWQPWTVARAHAALKKSKTYLYFFTRRPPYFPGEKFLGQDPPEKFGAMHTLEQLYFSNNLDRGVPPRPYTALDREIADAASSYFINFARNGDPNGGSLKAWPAFTGAGGQTMVIGDMIGAGAVPLLPALNFFDIFYGSKLGRPVPF